VSVRGGASRRLIKVAPGGKELIREFRAAISHVEPGDITGMSICGNGSIGVISSRREVGVIDTRTDSLLLNLPGRCGSVSPDGFQLAFLDPNRGLTVRSVNGVETRLG